MDKYARQSHKTNQRARRRNNTAQHLLENQLKQLDKERQWGQVSFQKDLNRVKLELSNLEGVSSDFSLPLDEDKKQLKNADPDFRHLLGGVNKSTTQNDGVFYQIGLDKIRETTTVKKDNNVISSSSSMTSSNTDIDTRHVSKNVTVSSSFPCLASSTPIGPILPSRKDVSETMLVYRSLTDLPHHNKLATAQCEYIHLNRRLPQRCNLFPCKLPQTYHTLGFRRDDLCPRNDNSDLSPLNSNSFDGSFDLKPGGTHKTDNKKSSNHNTKWIKTNNGTAHEFNPTINGPIFGYRPEDPVLERIRQHRKEPILNEIRPCARVTIRDRIRGVKQLVKEMKTTNEKIKPEDWATNYGKRVPTRVLLNPVVPGQQTV